MEVRDVYSETTPVMNLQRPLLEAFPPVPNVLPQEQQQQQVQVQALARDVVHEKVKPAEESGTKTPGICGLLQVPTTSVVGWAAPRGLRQANQCDERKGGLGRSNELL
eukprot:3538467-Amphidinium_carterae.1